MDDIDTPFGFIVSQSALPGGLDRVDREVWTLMRDIVGARTVPGLVSLSILTDDYLPWIERRWVHRARREGMSWSAIARMLGRSRQAVQERLDRAVDVSDLLPPTLRPSAARLDRREWIEIATELRQVRAADADDVVPW